jgi:lysophospholipase L1-like esterase
VARIADTIAIALLAYFVASKRDVPHVIQLVGIATLLLIAARLARRVSPRWLLLTVTMLSCAAAVFVAAEWSARAAHAVRIVSRLMIREHEPVATARTDERYGWVLKPNSRDRHRDRDYDVTYTIDADGRRVTPSPPHPRARIVFVGDSFTFGHGVEDDETFPARLGAAWPDVKVVNAGVNGWGLTQAYLAILDLLEGPPPPDAVVLVMIPDDQQRSYLREPIVAGVDRRLEFVDGQLTWIRSSEAVPKLTAELLEKEVRMNRDVTAGMKRACDGRHVPFAVVLLSEDGGYEPDFVYGLAQSGIPLVDLSRLAYERFPHDPHPTATGQRQIAEAIAASPISRYTGRAPR